MAAQVKRAVILLGACSLGACAHYSVPYAEVGAAHDRSRVSITGYFVAHRTALGELTYLCPAPRNGWNDGSCIDLVPGRTDPARQPPSLIGSCVTVRGRFTSFEAGTIGIGNLASDIGLIEVDRVQQCATGE